MPDGEDGTTARSPAAAFARLGDATRVDILRALWAADGPATYAELMRRAGVEDSGRFNYHLGQLTGHFVRRTDRGYELRTAGAQVVRAVLAGVITEDPTFGPVEVDAACPHCGEGLQVAYADERVVVRCVASGGGPIAAFDLPPAALEGASPAEVFELAPAWYTAKIRPMIRGRCPECARPTSLAVDVCGDHAVVDDHVCEACGSPFLVDAAYECDHCSYARRFPLYHLFHTDPDVAAFFHDHGVDLGRWSWADAERLVAYDERVAHTDPLRIEVAVTLDDDRLELIFDEELAVVEVRPPGSS